MYVNCISCGHKFDLGKAYDDYEGPVRCPTCRAMLQVRTVDGSVRGVGFFQPARASSAPASRTAEQPDSYPIDTAQAAPGAERHAA